jgi:hypothetical protein
MSERRAHAQERRRDRRIPVAARVRIEPREGAGVVQAELVDVSAGGLRARCLLPRVLEAGRFVNVEITVQEGGRDGPAPLVNLRGEGEVVRIENADAKDHYHTALRFTGALSLREPFAQMLLF